MSGKLKVVRSLELDDLMLLRLDELEHLINLGDLAFKTKMKNIVAKYEQQSSELAANKEQWQKEVEQQQADLLAFEPQIQQHYASVPVKLNVGGKYFSTNLENLTRDPRTYFGVMFSGRWNIKINPKDDAVFIDRDPTYFGLILNYLRDGTIEVDELSTTQTNLLLREVDFYQLGSLYSKLDKAEFFPNPINAVTYSNNNSMARVGNDFRQWGTSATLFSLTPFSPRVLEKHVKITHGQSLRIGAAFRSDLAHGTSTATNGWYLTFPGGGKALTVNGNAMWMERIVALPIPKLPTTTPTPSTSLYGFRTLWER
ncbi:hypothetical protein BASA81_003244 [Batrachochytrium salamandrivorans]|nr:hypothetical protein BASA81_003244 [Batrachochytrium salamandrivorans]